MRQRGKLATIAVLVAVLASLSVFVGAASASWPGANGKIFFQTGDIDTDRIFSVNPDGTDLQFVSSAGGAQDFSGSFELSPDGTQFVYNLAFHGDFAVVLASSAFTGHNANEYPVGPCCDLDGGIRGMGIGVWAPDSSRVLFTGRLGGFDAGVWVVNRDRTGLTQIIARPDVVVDSARWSPDATKISFRVGATTYSVKANGTGPVTIIASGYPDIGRDDPFFENFAFSPNGARRAFVLPDATDLASNIYTSNLAGGDVQQVTSLLVDCFSLCAFFPDSTFHPFVIGWQAIADHTAPVCELTAQIPGPPKQLKITVQDSGAGIGTITHSEMNATVSVPSVAAGTTDPLTITATKTHATKESTVSLTVTDAVGNVTTCDPRWPAARRHRVLPVRDKPIS